MANQVLYGFLEHQDIFAEQLVSPQVLTAIDTAITRSVEEHNRQMNAIMNLFVESTTEYKRRFVQTTVHRLQPLDDNGRARPVRVRGFYDVAWPIQEAGTAWGANYVARVKMTVGDANRITTSMLEADMRWMRDHILAAFLDDDGWTFEDEKWGSLVVAPIANGDATTYQILSGSDQMATDDHIQATATAIDDATNPFIAGAQDLREHPENGNTVVFFIPTNIMAAVMALDTFYQNPDPNLTEGVGLTRLTASLGIQVPGEILGYESASKAWFVEWRSLPSDYSIGTTIGGIAPLRMRQDPEQVLNGFNRVADRADHPFLESQFLRRAGFGAWNRVNAYVLRTGNGTYAVPTGYTNPQP